ncbi:MAG: hypothetical protein M1814_004804 [Vezdaea aestivalis]|nr:MAG: hypothetical protein M1814_004804 [Vezdaea aestivalis]
MSTDVRAIDFGNTVNWLRYSTKGPYGLTIVVNPSDDSSDKQLEYVVSRRQFESLAKKDSGTYWPKDLLPKTIPGARVLSFGYDADVIKMLSMASQNRIREHAQSLIAELARIRAHTNTNEQPIIFVTHSLGGLVCQDALLYSAGSPEPHISNVAEKVQAIAFLGTPHCGADLAKWAGLAANFVNLIKRVNRSILQVLDPDSEVLARIQQDFASTLRIRTNWKITCFHEELSVFGVGEIVPKKSATLSGYQCIGIHSNHMDMTKYNGRQDPGYQHVAGELWRWARESEQSSSSAGLPTASTPAEIPLTTEKEKTNSTTIMDHPIQNVSKLQDPGSGNIRSESVQFGGSQSIMSGHGTFSNIGNTTNHNNSKS